MLASMTCCNTALPQSAPVPQRPVPASTVTAGELVQQLEPISRDLTVVRCSLEQLAAKQEQMVQNIATLQAAEQDIKQKMSSPPPSRPAPPRKPPEAATQSSAVQSSSVPSPPPPARPPLAFALTAPLGACSPPSSSWSSISRRQRRSVLEIPPQLLARADKVIERGGASSSRLLAA